METVIELNSFIRSCEGVLSADDIVDLIDFLAQNPRAGNVIPQGNGLRKLRWARQGMGKRGGARVIYYHLTEKGAVYLLLAYAKARQENITKDELNQLIQLMK